MAWSSPVEVNASAGLDNFIPYLSEVTQFWFGRMMIIAIFMIFIFGYMRSKDANIWGAFAVSSYICFVIGLFFWVIGLLTGLDFAWVIGITLVSSILLLLQNKD